MTAERIERTQEYGIMASGTGGAPGRLCGFGDFLDRGKSIRNRKCQTIK